MGVCGGAGIPDHDSAFAEIAERWCSTRSWIHPIQAKKKKQAQSWKRAGTASDAEFGASSWMAMDGASCCAMHGRLFHSGVDEWAKISPDPASPDLITHGEYGNQYLGKSGDPTLNQRRVNFKVANVKVQMPTTQLYAGHSGGQFVSIFPFTSIMRSYDIFFCFDFRYSETAGCDDVGQMLNSCSCWRHETFLVVNTSPQTSPSCHGYKGQATPNLPRITGLHYHRPY